MSSRFITETELADVKKKRQEEWDKVRQADDPLERPEEPYDGRSLFEKLQEQKQKKDLEYEEAHKLKNMIKGLDDDEIEFLDLVDRTKLAADRKKELEEERELNDYRNRVAILQEKSIEDRLQSEVAVNKPKLINNRNSQQKLLKGVVIKKSETQKRKLSESEIEENPGEVTHGNKQAKNDEVEVGSKDVADKSEHSRINLPTTGLKCVAILPGLGCYEDSSTDSSDCEITTSANGGIDLLGRKIEKKSKDS